MKSRFFAEEKTIQARIQHENAVGKATLEEYAKNNDIKKVMQSIANVLLQNVLAPIRKAAKVAKSFDEIQPEEFRKAIALMAEAHSAQGRQFGGVLKTTYPTAKAIIANIQSVRHLLNTLCKTLSNIPSQANTPEKIASVMKVIADCGYGYVEACPSLRRGNQESFTPIKDMIWPSPEEMHVRISRKEVDTTPKFATELGIGREDVVSLNEMLHKVHLYAGKAVFAGVDMEQRLKLTAVEFDRLYAELKQAQQSQPQSHQSHPSHPSNEANNRNEDIEDVRITKAAAAFKKFIDLQREHFGERWVKLLLEKKDASGGSWQAYSTMESAELQQLAQSFEAASIKLARRLELPLVASISGSTARPLITLQHKGGFYSGKTFDAKRVQILTHGIKALFNQGGHHAEYEVQEAANRLIDYIILYCPTRLPASLQTRIARIAKRQNDPLQVESLLPYFKPGCYSPCLYSGSQKSIKAKGDEATEFCAVRPE